GPWPCSSSTCSSPAPPPSCCPSEPRPPPGRDLRPSRGPPPHASRAHGEPRRPPPAALERVAVRVLVRESPLGHGEHGGVPRPARSQAPQVPAPGDGARRRRGRRPHNVAERHPPAQEL